MNKIAHVVLLLAGGHGYRMHSSRPKQFMEIAGTPVIFHTLQVFQQHPDIDRIYVVCSPEWKDFVETTVRKGGIDKFGGTFPAGETSIDSLRNGIRGLQKEWRDKKPAVLTHEAVRPLVSAEVISLNLHTFHTHGNAITAIRSHEAYMVSPDGISSESSIPREHLYRAQTPQTFYLNDLTETFHRADSLHLSNSQSLYTLMSEVRSHQPLYIAPGSEQNFKLTLPEDLEVLEAILAYRRRQP
ncbi:MAG: 2-C-methyl-D-erythritol 4-phosphate cytidylyltransferase [Paraprevotella sp.]|nr:2-C-methyl-D-erythritol 4-phosphate cytidylyltransferase [Paraprevotella sp.]